MYLPDNECSDSRVGGVCEGVWWSIPGVGSPEYNELKSSGVLLHFLWFIDEFLSTDVIEGDRPSWPADDNPNNRFSCDDVNPMSRLSWKDMNFVSWFECCKLVCDKAWSSRSPCCKPKRPPTKFGRSSSISLPWPQEPLVKFSCLLKIAGNMLNCWESALDWEGLNPKLLGTTLGVLDWWELLLLLLLLFVVEPPLFTEFPTDDGPLPTNNDPGPLAAPGATPPLLFVLLLWCCWWWWLVLVPLPTTMPPPLPVPPAQLCCLKSNLWL